MSIQKVLQGQAGSEGAGPQGAWLPACPVCGTICVAPVMTGPLTAPSAPEA